MGCVANIDYDKFPAQHDRVGTDIIVHFNYDTSKAIKGKILRFDTEEPGCSIFQLEDGRVILDTECQWAPAPKKKTLKIRAIRRTREESKGTEQEIPATLEAVIQFVADHVPHLDTKEIKVQPYSFRRDEVMGWDKTYMVCSDAGVMAFTDSPIT